MSKENVNLSTLLLESSYGIIDKIISKKQIIMEKTINPVCLIQAISGRLRNEKLKNIDEVGNEIKLLGEYLGTGTMQTVIFSAIYDRCAGGSYSDIDDFARCFKCSSPDVLTHKREIEEMLTRGLIELANDKMQCSLPRTTIFPAVKPTMW